jgi:hypothetical protein
MARPAQPFVDGDALAFMSREGIAVDKVCKHQVKPQLVLMEEIATRTLS